MRSIVRFSAAALVVAACVAPSGAQAVEGNVRVPFSGGQVSESGPQPAGGTVALIGFIDSPSAFCSQPNPAVNICMITFPRLFVDASPNYVTYLTLELNDRLVARFTGFFQTTLDVANPFGPGIKVACGKPGSGGDPAWGRRYRFTVRAKDSAALSSANYGEVWCPPFLGPLPNIP
jgi:hypothetical protein